jgi:hypothetical protein
MRKRVNENPFIEREKRYNNTEYGCFIHSQHGNYEQNSLVETTKLASGNNEIHPKT